MKKRMSVIESRGLFAYSQGDFGVDSIYEIDLAQARQVASQISIPRVCASPLQAQTIDDA